MTEVINIFYGFYVRMKRTESNLSMKFISVTLVKLQWRWALNKSWQTTECSLRRWFFRLSHSAANFFGQQLALSAPTWPSPKYWINCSDEFFSQVGHRCPVRFLFINFFLSGCYFYGSTESNLLSTYKSLVIRVGSARRASWWKTIHHSFLWIAVATRLILIAIDRKIYLHFCALTRN